ncbi:hypothetical protein MMC12_001891 [Toensbergia leucococca]|nr:hypothetical protein [Toensbergia leucococca]
MAIVLPPPDTTSPAILLLDLPPGTLCGIDLLSFTTSARFQGIKDIPPGWHFIFTGASSSLSIRHGFWFHIPETLPSSPAPPPLLVHKWDLLSESLTPETDPSHLQHHTANFRAIWNSSLTPYRQSASDKPVPEPQHWALLTTHITRRLLSHLTGSSDWTITSTSCAAQDRDEIPGLSFEESRVGEERELGVLGIDLKRTWREGAVGRERTEGAVDRSWALGEIVGRAGTWDGGGEKEPGLEEWGSEVLGEMEICFLMVLTVGNFSCLEEWKRILGVVFTCKKVVVEREAWFASVVELLRMQLQRCEDVEGGLFDMSDDGAVWLKALLVDFKRNLEEVFAGGEEEEESLVGEEMEALEGFLKGEFGWELGDDYLRRGLLLLEDGERVEMEMGELDGVEERGEYAPVVVELG